MEALLPSSISPKISAILQSHVYPRVGHVLRALARFKSALLDALGKTKRKRAIGYRRSRSSSRKRRSKKQLAGSGGGGLVMRPHLAWSGRGLSPASRRVVEEVALDGRYHVCCSCHGSPWNAVVLPAAPTGVAPAGGGEDGTAAEYCGYLRWLEEEAPDDVLVMEDYEVEDDADVDGGENEIDRLAERFIARCHANFLLEKQESYDRRCQDLIARSM